MPRDMESSSEADVDRHVAWSPPCQTGPAQHLLHPSCPLESGPEGRILPESGAQSPASSWKELPGEIDIGDPLIGLLADYDGASAACRHPDHDYSYLRALLCLHRCAAQAILSAAVPVHPAGLLALRHPLSRRSHGPYGGGRLSVALRSSSPDPGVVRRSASLFSF